MEKAIIAPFRLAIVSALYAAHGGGTPVSDFSLQQEIRGTRPLSVPIREQVDALRVWAAERTTPAHRAAGGQCNSSSQPRG